MKPFLVLLAVCAALDACGASANGTGADATADADQDAALNDAADTATADAVVADASPDVEFDTATGTDDAAGGPFTCGASLSCQPNQACTSMGQGVCGGPAPDANGKCGPNCSAMQCGGGMHCLCTSFQCVDLPSGCHDCTCAKSLPNTSQCTCQDTGGSVRLDCPGA